MANPYKFYLQHMHEKTGFRATWDPGKPLKIGFIGKLEGPGVFTVFTSFSKEGITPEILTDSTSDSLDYISNDQVTFGVKLAGSAPALGSVLTETDAGFELQFKSEKAILFKIDGYKTHQIINTAAIQDQIKHKYYSKNWDWDWIVVTELIEAEAATIIISNSGNSSLTLKAKSTIGAQNLKITDASLNLSTALETGSTLKFITQSHLTPLYKVMGLVKPFLAKPILQTKSVEQIAHTDGFRLLEFNEEEVDSFE